MEDVILPSEEDESILCIGINSIKPTIMGLNVVGEYTRGNTHRGFAVSLSKDWAYKSIKDIEYYLQKEMDKEFI